MEPFRPIADKYVIKLLETHTVFDIDLRLKLIAFLDEPLFYNKYQTVVFNAIEKYIQNFQKYIDYNDLSIFEMPIVT